MKAATVCCKNLETIDWRDWSACSFREEFAVFRLFLPDDAEASAYVRTLLQPDELARAERFRRVNDRNRFVCGRALTKIVLGKFADRNPAAIRLVAGINKKPVVEGVNNLHINVSHAGDWIVLAVSRTDVGIDLEKIDDKFPVEDILSTSFSSDEQGYIEGSSNPKEQFYQLWTRKEALIKATAKGIDDDFPQIPSLDGEHQLETNLLGKDGSWTVASFRVDDNHPAAVAYRSGAKTAKFYTVGSGLFTQN